MSGTRASVGARPNSVRIGTTRNAMRITSIASNIHPRPLVTRSLKWKRFRGTASRRATKDSAAKATLGEQELGVQHGRARGAADGVVAENDELQAEDGVLPYPAYDGRHPALGVTVEDRLRSVRLLPDDDRVLRRARQS